VVEFAHRLAHEREQPGFVLERAALPHRAIIEAALDGFAHTHLAALPHELDTRKVVEVEGEIGPGVPSPPLASACAGSAPGGV